VESSKIQDFLNVCMGACLTGAGIILPDGFKDAVLSVWIAPAQTYAFVEFVTKECALIAMGLSGIEFMGNQLKISRPNNYTAHGGGNPFGATASALMAAALSGAPSMSAVPAIMPAPAAPADLTQGRRDNRPAWMVAADP
jgi:hypothetical protein